MSQCSSGNDLVLLASSIAIAISQNLSPEEINILSNFFSALGSNLGILAAQRETGEQAE